MRKTRPAEDYSSWLIDVHASPDAEDRATRRTDSRTARPADDYETQRADARTARPADDYATRRADSRTARPADDYETRRTDSRSARPADDYETRRTDSRTARPADDRDTRRTDSRTARPADDYETRRTDARAADDAEPRRTHSRTGHHVVDSEPRRTDSRAARPADDRDTRRVDARTARPADDYETRRVDTRAARPADDRDTRRVDTRAARPADDYETRRTDSRTARPADDYETRRTESRTARPADDYETRRVDSRTARPADDYETRRTDSRTARPADDYETRRVDSRTARPADDYETRRTESRTARPADDYEPRIAEAPATRKVDEYASRRNTPRISRIEDEDYEPRRTVTRTVVETVVPAPRDPVVVEEPRSSRTVARGTRSTAEPVPPVLPELAPRRAGGRHADEKAAAHAMTPNEIWFRVEENCQAVALRQGLIEADERFTLTPHQARAVEDLDGFLKAGKDRCLLVAPTGAGKTEVMFRVGVHSYLSTGRCTVIVVPTRDLSRQHLQYMSDRLEGTGLTVAEMHGGVPPRRRAQDLDQAQSGAGAFIVGSAMMLHSKHYRNLLEGAGLVIIDDVNAFDERQDLSHLRSLFTPCLFASATPDPVAGFLRSVGAYRAVTEMKTMPFASPATTIHRIEAGFGENIYSQVDKALPFLNEHLAAKSRVYVISRTRAKVPTLCLYLQDRLGLPVAMLHGEMADTKEHSSRQRGTRSVWATGPETRTDMMRRFRDNTPSVLVATNLVGSGLDIPMADLIIITDADHFSEAESEQLIGRVGRRERPSDAVLIVGTVLSREGNSNVRGRSVVKDGRVVLSYGMARGRRRR